MSVIAYTLQLATPQRLIYSFTGDAAGTLAYATMVADSVAASALAAALAAVAGQTDSDAKATAALITGKSFVGGGSGTPTLQTYIRARTQTATATASKAPVGLTAVDSGAGNNPDLVLTPDGATTGWLEIECLYSTIR